MKQLAVFERAGGMRALNHGEPLPVHLAATEKKADRLRAVGPQEMDRGAQLALLHAALVIDMQTLPAGDVDEDDPHGRVPEETLRQRLLEICRAKLPQPRTA